MTLTSIHEISLARHTDMCGQCQAAARQARLQATSYEELLCDTGRRVYRSQGGGVQPRRDDGDTILELR
jgi:hypothetical protein